MTTHATCTHDVTPKARAACRAKRAELEAKAVKLLARLEGSPNMIYTAAGRVMFNSKDRVYARDLTLIECCRLIVAYGWDYRDVCYINS